MIIKNGLVFQEDGSFAKKDLYIENGRFVSAEAEVSDKTEYDADGLKAVSYTHLSSSFSLILNSLPVITFIT